MHGRWLARILQILVILLIGIAGFGQAVLQLWNHLMPRIFGLPSLTFWQAVGLMALCWILFGSWRGGRTLGGWRGRMRGRWDAMAPEERELFRKGMRDGCAPPAASSAPPGTL